MVNSKNLFRSGMLITTLLVGGLGSAYAQSTTPDATLSEVFATDTLAPNRNSLGTQTYINSFGAGVGFDPSATFFANSGATSAATAQSVYNAFVYNGSTNFNAGDNFQIGVHSAAVNSTGNPTTIFASIYTLNGSAAQSVGNSVPLGTAVVRNLAIAISSNTSVDQIYYSATGQLTGALTSGQSYVVAFSPTGPGQTTPVDYATVQRINIARTGQTGQASTLENTYLTANNGGDTGGTIAAQYTGANAPVAFRLEAASAAVPEPSAVVGLLSMTGMFGGSVLLRRRRRA